MKTKRNPDAIHSPLASYTHGMEISGQQRWLVLSGQIGANPDGSMPMDPVQQFKIALNNIHHNLLAANMGIADIVKLTMYIVGEMDTEQRRGILASWLQGHQPCMTLLYVAALANPDIHVEIDALACKDVD